MTDRHARGMEVRRAVPGNAHVDRAAAAKTDLGAPCRQMITETARGTPLGVGRAEAAGTLDAGAGAARRARRRGGVGAAPARDGPHRASERDVTEVFQHVAIHAGVPRAKTAIRVAKRIFAEREGEE